MAARDYWQLTKPGITRHVVIATAAGYWLGLGDRPFSWTTLLPLLVGTGLVSGGTLGLNMWWERDVDARMPRTRNRPLASGRITARSAVVFCAAILLAGLALLGAGVNALTMLLAATTFASYLLVYTPLKKRSTLNTLVGCFPGALPALGGWTAARGVIDGGGVALFAFLFVWQLPHAVALAWLYRADYAAGGLVMVGHDDATGTRTARKATIYALLLLTVTATLGPFGVTGAAAALAALALGVAFLAYVVSWAYRPSALNARRTFLASVVHLTVVLLLISLGR